MNDQENDFNFSKDTSANKDMILAVVDTRYKNTHALSYVLNMLDDWQREGKILREDVAGIKAAVNAKIENLSQQGEHIPESKRPKMMK